MTKRHLPPKQAVFVQEYLIDLNASAAYLRAGYKESPAAHTCAAQLLSKPSIQAEIDRLLQLRSKRTEITADRILKELAALSYMDPADLFEQDGSLKRIHDIPEAARRCIAGIEVVELFDGQGDQKHAFGLLKKIRLAPKTPNLELLGKHLKLWVERHQHENPDGTALFGEDQLLRMAEIIQRKRGGKA